MCRNVIIFDDFSNVIAILTKSTQINFAVYQHVLKKLKILDTYFFELDTS